MATPLALAPGKFAFGGAYTLALIAFGVILFIAIGALSHAHERPFSAALIYLAAGLVVNAVVRALDLAGKLDPLRDHLFVERTSELAVIVALFTAGMRVRRGLRDRGWGAPGRLLLIAMPLTIAAVGAWASGLMGMGAGAAIALGAALAPTDPVLAGGLGVRPPDAQLEEAEREREFIISVEAGLNDGRALPFLALGLLVADGRLGDRFAGWIGIDGAYAVAAALLLGYVAGRGLAVSTAWLREREFMSLELDPWVGLAAAPLVYGSAELLDMYGFLAVLAAGYAYTRGDGRSESARRVHAGVNEAQLFLEIAAILMVGILVSWHGLGKPGVAGWLLVPVLFLVIRPAAVFAALARSPVSVRDRAFLAWFGVKGIASINYLALAVASSALPPAAAATLAWTVIVAVMASVLVHGASATPVMRRLAESERAGVGEASDAADRHGA